MQRRARRGPCCERYKRKPQHRRIIRVRRRRMRRRIRRRLAQQRASDARDRATIIYKHLVTLESRAMTPGRRVRVSKRVRRFRLQNACATLFHTRAARMRRVARADAPTERVNAGMLSFRSRATAEVRRRVTRTGVCVWRVACRVGARKSDSSKPRRRRRMIRCNAYRRVY